MTSSDNNNRGGSVIGSSSKGPWIGVDFGHTHSCAAVYDQVRGHPKWMRLKGIALSPCDNSSKSGRLVPTSLLFVYRKKNKKNKNKGNDNNNLLSSCCCWIRVRDYVSVVDADNNNNTIKDYGYELYALVGAKAIELLEKEQSRQNTVHQAYVSNFKRQLMISLQSSSSSTPAEAAAPTATANIKVVPLFENGDNNDDDKFLSTTTTTAPIEVTPVDCAVLFMVAMRLSCQHYLAHDAVKKGLGIPLLKCQNDAVHLPEDVPPNVVVGCPANWTRAARRNFISKVLKPAGYSGYAQTIVESSAAALSYGVFVSSTSSSSKNDRRRDHYHLHHQDNKKPKFVLVFDMGGGTTDVTVIAATTTTTSNDNRGKNKALRSSSSSSNNNNRQDQDDNNSHDFFRVLASRGLTLGGDDMDQAMMELVLRKKRKKNMRIRSLSKKKDDDESKWNLLRRCCRAKEELCENYCNNNKDKAIASSTARVEVLCGCGGGGGGDNNGTTTAPPDDIIVVDINEYESEIQGLLQKAQHFVEETVRAASNSYYSSSNDDDSSSSSNNNNLIIAIDEVVLVGGSTLVPAVRQMLETVFISNSNNNKNNHNNVKELCTSVHPRSAVAVGAAVQSAIVSNLIPLHSIKSAMMLDALPYSIGVLSITEASTKTTASTSAVSSTEPPSQQQHFVEVLAKDANLPAKGKATFELATIDQAGVTILVVEKVDDDTVQQQEHYEKVHEFTFLLHRVSQQQLESISRRLIEVGMCMKETGELVVSIFDEHDPEHVAKRKKEKLESSNEEEKKGDHGENIQHRVVAATKDHHKQQEQEPVIITTKEQCGLMLLLVIVVILYVAVKAVFNEIEIEMTEEVTATDL